MSKLCTTLRNGFFAMITMGFLASTTPAQAATLNVVGGQLLGASGVNVNGILYDVEFLDGSCVSLFTGCDAVTDFTFQTQTDAFTAAQALLDTVLINSPLGQFDTFPGLVAGGISGSLVGSLYIPFGFDFTSFVFLAVQNGNVNNVNSIVGPTGQDIRTISTGNPFAFARFSPTPVSVVPLPPAGLLFGTGLVFLAALRKRAKKLAHA